MPDDKEKQQGKLVDIDTSGPGAEVSIPEEKKIEAEPEVEVKDETTENIAKSDDAPAESTEQPDVQESKPQDQKLEEYGEGVGHEHHRGGHGCQPGKAKERGGRAEEGNV